MSATCVVNCRNTLGEGCVWDPRDESLYWTDIEQNRIYRLASDQSVTTFPMPKRAAFILPRREPGFVIGFADSVAIANPDLSQFSVLHAIEPDLPETRVNDAAVDPFGGVVFGTFDERDRKPSASLYRLAPNGELRWLLGDITISNGIAFSPDGAVMYFADTPVGLIRRFRIGPDFSDIEEVDPLASPEIAPGKPDGATVDRDGYYWNARVWGSCVVRIAPDGRLDRTIELPALGPTCVALAGAGRPRLYATSLRTRQSESELAETPLAGGLFVADVDVPGTKQLLVALCRGSLPSIVDLRRDALVRGAAGFRNDVSRRAFYEVCRVWGRPYGGAPHRKPRST
jgi:L-arabinonolactonase